MKATPASKVLAPYGAVQFVTLATKVGMIGGGGKGISPAAPQRRVVRLETAG